MKKGKRLFSYLGSGFAFSMLFGLAAFLPEAKAEAKLSLSAIDYENSTITIETDNDTTLYFSDKNKKKWETSMDSFVGNKCTMDISWVSVTKDYVMTFKGDKTEDILTVTIPKQVSNFKAKYDKKGSKVVFTNDSDRKVQYRKNNTTKWTTIVDKNNFGTELQRLYENGAKVYFRLEAENGSNGNVGKRYSKEVVCSIAKKSEAPKVAINDDATITVQSGWQVRRVKIKESSGVEYVIGYSEIDTIGDSTNLDSTTKWYTYRSEKDVPVTEFAKELAPISGDTSSEKETFVYLQFRKEASSSAQVSRITTVKIPKQEEAPSSSDASIEYTSSTTFNIKVEKATTKNPYEYCIVGGSDVSKDGKIIDLQDAKWKMISSSVATEVKKADAPVGSYIFLRKKAVGKLGEDDFRLATDYVCVREKIEYPEAENGVLTINSGVNSDGTVDVIDGVCTTDNKDGYIKFNIVTTWNAKIKDILFSTDPNPTKDTVSIATATHPSSVAKYDEKDKNGDPLYNITATITSLKLNSENQTKLDNENSLRLYAYIQYDTSGDAGLSSTMENDKAKGLVINLKKKSKIEKLSEADASELSVKRIIGATGSGDLNEKVSYKATFNGEDGETDKIESVTLGNYKIAKDCYTYTNSTFTIDMKKLETISGLESYYGKEQKLVIKLKNGEKLNDIGITLIEPVSLKQFYSWAFRSNSLPNTEQKVVTTSTNGTKTETTEYKNNYSVEYTQTSQSVDDITVKNVTVKSATLESTTKAAISILDKTDNSAKKIEFSNDLLKTSGFVGLVSQPVQITFYVDLSNGTRYEYVIKEGCMFTVLS